MNFDSFFFFPEVREGFYISTSMKRFWAAQMEVMQRLIDVCIQNDIKIFVDYGTLLGTIRHEGFVPWDDDIDVVIFRKDQKRLYELLRREFSDEWELLESQDEKYLQPWYRINNSDSFLFDEDKIREFHGCVYPVGVDIYILDNPPADNAENDIVSAMFEIVYGLCYDEKISVESIEKALSFLEECFNLRLNTDDYTQIKKIMLTIAQELMASYDQNETGDLLKLDGGGYSLKRYKTEWFKDMLWMPFENTYVPVPIGYEDVMAKNFGSGYMNVVMGGGMHDYPGFKELAQEYIRKTGEDHKYNVDKEILVRKYNSREFEKKNKQVIVFLPYLASKWDYLKPYWREASDNPANQVYVIDVPIHIKDHMGRIDGLMEKEKYPDNIILLNGSEFDMDALEADVIYIQQPYDGMCDAFEVDRRFFSEALRKKCKQLIYVPGFSLMEFDSKDHICYKTFEYFVPMPGVVNADKTIVQSENVRRMYLDYLCEWTHEDLREFWENKVAVSEII